MKRSEVISLIENPNTVQKEQILDLQEVISEYPYFTSAQLLLCKAYFQSENLNYEKQLRLSAAYSPDRSRMHELLYEEEIELDHQLASEKSEQEAIIQEEAEASQQAEMSEEDAFLESQILTAAINSSILQEVGDDDEGIAQASEEANSEYVDESLPSEEFNEEVEHSFSDWLKHYRGNEGVDETPHPKSEAIKAISEQAKNIQQKAEFYSASKMAKLSVIESDDLVTETLAQVYEAQGKYERAIQAYQKLQLKFPEKKVYFAGRIKAVEEKIKS